MRADDQSDDAHDRVTTLSVFDLNMATAYYACVFDAEVDDLSAKDRRPRAIGDQRFMLKLQKGGAPSHDPYVAMVEDADVCVARGAAKGGMIIDAVADGPDHRRTGALRDPFGLSWRIANRV